MKTNKKFKIKNELVLNTDTTFTMIPPRSYGIYELPAGLLKLYIWLISHKENYQISKYDIYRDTGLKYPNIGASLNKLVEAELISIDVNQNLTIRNLKVGKINTKKIKTKVNSNNSNITLKGNTLKGNTLKGNSDSTLKGDSNITLKGNTLKGNTLKGNTLKGNSDSTLKGNSDSTLKGDSDSTLKGNSITLKGNTLKGNSIALKGDNSITLKGEQVNHIVEQEINQENKVNEKVNEKENQLKVNQEKVLDLNLVFKNLNLKNKTYIESILNLFGFENEYKYQLTMFQIYIGFLIHKLRNYQDYDKIELVELNQLIGNEQILPKIYIQQYFDKFSKDEHFQKSIMNNYKFISN